jgi:RimJ/RimL family protein N-acetyltransferase
MDVPSTYRCLPYPRLERDAFAVRAVQPGDIESIRQWRNDQMDVLRQSVTIQPEAQSAYFARHVWPSFDDEQPAQVLLAVEESGELIGYGGLVHIAWEHRRAEVSFLLATELARDEAQHLTRFARFFGLMKEQAFEGLQFHRLTTETFAFRTGHIATLESSGFRREGQMRDHVLVDGTFWDSLIHGCLADDD